MNESLITAKCWQNSMVFAHFRYIVLVFRVKNHDFTPKKIIFFPVNLLSYAPPLDPPLDTPLLLSREGHHNPMLAKMGFRTANIWMDRKKDGVLKLRCVHICKFLNQPISIPVSSADETLCSPIFYNVCLSPYIFTVAFFIRIISRL